ncbi:MAG: rod shape-determining protein MreC [Candidatus Omnitrophota bacterium]
MFRFPLKVISGIYYALDDTSGFRELNTKNKVLKETVANLEKINLSLREYHLENQRLKKLLDFTEEDKPKLIPSMVIGRDYLGSQSTIIIDKGKKHNVKKDMSVVGGHGLVGRVYETGYSISRVILITSKDLVVGGIVQRTRDIGSVFGKDRSNLIMKYLELDCDVKEGDEVITSGFSGIYEKGILIGKIIKVEKDPSGLYLNATIRPEADIMKLEEVLVVK